MCLLHNLREAELDYRDIIYMLDKDIVVQERRGKHERNGHMTNLLQEIASNAEVAVTKAEQALQLVKGKNGKKEEEDFLKKILLNGKEVEGKITSVKNKCAVYIAHLSCGERHSYLKHSYSYRMPKQNIATA